MTIPALVFFPPRPLGSLASARPKGCFFWPGRSPKPPPPPPVRAAWTDLDPAQVWDAHVHLLGVGDNGDAADVGFNDARGTLSWPLAAAQRYFFLNATCIEGTAGIDRAWCRPSAPDGFRHAGRPQAAAARARCLARPEWQSRARA